MNIDYAKSFSRKTPTQVIKDNFWTVNVLTPKKKMEKERYYLVIEGVDKSVGNKEVVKLKGFSVDRTNFLLPVGGQLIFKNTELISRQLQISGDNEALNKDIDVKPSESTFNVFTAAGDYVITDVKYPWNKLYVKVIEAAKVFPISKSKNRFTISDIPPGTYSLYLYYGQKWVYKEEFTVVGQQPFTFAYRIVNGKPYRNDSSAYSTNKIVLSPN